MRAGRCPGHDRRRVYQSRPLAILMAVALVSMPILSGCSPTVATHGHNLEDDQIARIEPGRSSRQEVLQLMGSPSALSAFDDEAWYYVSQRTERQSFYQEDVVEQEVVTVTFDDQDRVAAVERHGLDQMAAVDPVDRVTPTAGASPSILKQLIGNIGRFSSGDSEPYSPGG